MKYAAIRITFALQMCLLYQLSESDATRLRWKISVSTAVSNFIVEIFLLKFCNETANVFSSLLLILFIVSGHTLKLLLMKVLLGL